MKISRQGKSSVLPIEIWLPLTYLIIGGLWILFSDKILLSLVKGDLVQFARFQTIKGWFYVFASGIFLFVLLWSYSRRNKRYIRLIENARKNVEKANKLKSTFLANLSHELRTPMNAINGFSDLIKQYVDNPDVSSQYHSIIRENSFKLLRIIENILDMSKIQVNLLELKISTFTIDQLCENLKNNSESIIPHDKILHVVKPGNASVNLSTDIERILKVCEILILNSISNPGKGLLVLSCDIQNGNFIADIHWERSFQETQVQMIATDLSMELSDSIGWDIAFGIVKLLQGNIIVNKLSDNTFRFILTVPQKIISNEF